MPRYNVEHEGKWVVFSSVVDDFVTPFMTVEEFVIWRELEYGETDTLDCINGRARFNTQTMHESLVTIGIIHGIDRVKEFVHEHKIDVDLLKIEKVVRDEEGN